jgi:hypothetical protein
MGEKRNQLANEAKDAGQRFLSSLLGVFLWMAAILIPAGIVWMVSEKKEHGAIAGGIGGAALWLYGEFKASRKSKQK